jgi:predicted acylesterase/phospholipase RssA
VSVCDAIRATTAAPMFFSPVRIEGGLYCDGALVANNPCAVAVEEAKV